MNSPINQPYISDSPLFLSLTAKEVEDFRFAARYDAIRAVASIPKDIHHPIYRDEITKCLLRMGSPATLNTVLTVLDNHPST